MSRRLRTTIGIVLALAVAIAIVHRLPIAPYSRPTLARVLGQSGRTAHPAPAAGAYPVATGAQGTALGEPRPAFGPAVGFRTHALLVEHFHEHGREFAGADIADYLRLAQTLRDVPAGGDVLETTRADGVITRFDRATGSFLAFDSDGVIRTFFRPNDGERYFRRQALRSAR
jgi:hypothetical protein